MSKFFIEISQAFVCNPILEFVTIGKCCISMTKLRMSSRRLHVDVETDRWAKPVSIPFDERKCHIHACDGIEDEFHSLFECLLYADLKKQYACIERYFVVSPSMYIYTLIQLF